MPNIDVKYDLAMAPGPGKTRVYFSQGDRGLGTATMSLFANNYPLYLEEGITAMIVGRKPDKTAYAYDCQISRDRRAVIVTAAEQMTAVAGTGEAQIIFTDGDGNVAGTCNFEVIVEADPTEGTTPSESDYAVFYQAIAAAGEAQTAAEEAAGSAATAQEAAAAAQEAAQENFDLIFTAPISEPIVTQTNIPATTNHTEEEVAAAYEAGKKVRARIHLTTGTPIAITFDLEPVYTVAMQTDDTERHMYSGMFVTGVDQLDAYQVMAAWDNGEPVIAFAGKISDYAEAVADLETDVSNLGGRVTVLEDKSIVAVPVRIPFYVIFNAITQSQATGETKRVDPSKVTTTEDPETLYNAVDLAMRTGKPVRFDLAILGNSGSSAVLDASVMRVSTLDASQTETRIGAYFTHADLNFSNNFNGLARLEISVTEEYTDNGTVYGVAAYATAEATA